MARLRSGLDRGALSTTAVAEPKKRTFLHPLKYDLLRSMAIRLCLASRGAGSRN
jgi:hypothetical protein